MYLKEKTYHRIYCFNNGTLNFVKLYVSKAKSIHKENEEKGIWNQKDHIKNPDGTAKKKEKKKMFV